MLKAVIFDFDGLLFDTETPLFEQWRDTLGAEGFPLTLEQWALNIGAEGYSVFDPHEKLRELVPDAERRAAIEREQRKTFLRLLDSQNAMPGVRAAIRVAKARGMKVAAASSSTHQWVDGRLEKLGLLDQFDATCCCEDVAEVKPDPALYLEALGRLGVDGKQAVAFEDSPPGAVAAKAAGIYCVAVPNPVTAYRQFPAASMRIKSLDAEDFNVLLDRIEKERTRAI